jgi:peptidoglycan hydrolase CwlO-like protein
MKEHEPEQVQQALQHERVLEPSHYDLSDQLARNHAALVELAAQRVHLENEWTRLQDEQSRIISEMTK